MFDLSPLVDAFGSIWLGSLVTIGVGLAVGFISAAFGIGGGFIITPFFNSVINLSAIPSVATSMGQMPFMSFSGLIEYFKQKKIRYREGGILLLGSLPASQAVAHYLGNIRETRLGQIEIQPGMSAADLSIILIFSVLIGVIGLYNIYRSYNYKDPAKLSQYKFKTRKNCNLAIFALGLVFGFFSALLGIGGGFFSFPFFVYYCGLIPIEAIATGLFAIFVTSAVTTINYIYNGEAMIALSLLVAVGAIVGARAGSKMAIQAPQQKLVLVLGVLQVSVVIIYTTLKFAF